MDYQVIIGDKRYRYPEGTTYREIVEKTPEKSGHVILVTVNGKLQELHRTLQRDVYLSFVTTGDNLGMETYRRSVVFLMLKAASDLLGDGRTCPVRVEHSISKGTFCTIRGMETVSEELLKRLDERMRELVREDLTIRKTSVAVEEARNLFKDRNMQDKYELFRFRRSSSVNIYTMEEYSDYFYGYMAASTAELDRFSLHAYHDGFVIQMPVASDPDVVPEFVPQDKLYAVFTEARNWNAMMGVNTVADLNNKIVEGKGNELILLQEALQEKKIGDIAETIANRPDVRFVLVAGPSSSGKTSFANRLSIQLRTQGLNPHLVSVDNYYKDRDQIPLDENGEIDFECMEALDVKLLNEHLKTLLCGGEVRIPKYSFGKGTRGLGAPIHMEENDILVIEGIHCLNDKLTYDIPGENKFKIYISALTQLNIDEHNRIPTTDGRLLRRMARDARTRNSPARETISMWPSVRRGEERNIFPYQEDADVMFNSASIYELAVLKQCCEPILHTVPQDAPEYQEATRLLKFLDYFLGFNSDLIPRNSIVREFAGGSCFDV